MTTTEAADRLGLKPETIKDYCRQGTVAAEKIGPLWWITAREVERFRRERRPRGRPKAS